MAITTITRIFTSTSPGGRPWLVQAYSADATGKEILKAGVANDRHYIKAIHVSCKPGTTAAYWTLIDDNESEIMPRIDMIDYNGDFYHKFIIALPCETGHGIRLVTEAADQIAVIMEGFSRTEQPTYRTDLDLAASASTSASVSLSLSASPSLTPSASPSISASASSTISASPSVTVSASPSISASPSVSG